MRVRSNLWLCWALRVQVGVGGGGRKGGEEGERGAGRRAGGERGVSLVLTVCLRCSGSQESQRRGGSRRGRSGGEVEEKRWERPGEGKRRGVGRASQCDKTPALAILSGWCSDASFLSSRLYDSSVRSFSPASNTCDGIVSNVRDSASGRINPVAWFLQDDEATRVLTTSRGTSVLDHFPRHSGLRPCQTLGRSSQVASQDRSSTAMEMRATLCRQLTLVSAATSNHPLTRRADTVPAPAA